MNTERAPRWIVAVLCWTLVGSAVAAAGVTNIVEGPITNNITTTVFWGEQYLLEVPRVFENGHVAGSSNGWYDVGSNVVLQAVADPYCAFHEWRGDTNAVENPLALSMTRPYTNLQAVFRALTTSNGTPYAWYARYGITNNFDTEDVSDSDGDGMTGREEYVWGSDPSDGESRPALVVVGVSNGYGVLGIQHSETGRVYYLFGKTDLLQGEWEGLTNSAGNGGIIEFQIRVTNDMRYYRGAAGLFP